MTEKLVQLRKKDETRERHKELTQQFSTWGDKLLQHADVLNRIQRHRTFTPITVQLAPTEGCQSDCSFCSVGGRPVNSFMPWDELTECLKQFAELGAKSVEITGGGNPLLYRDRVAKKNVNDIIKFAVELDLDVGIITNSESLKAIDPLLHDSISWIRISLIRLDEGVPPERYDFNGFPYEKLGFSYIVYEPGTGPVRGNPYSGTDEAAIERIAKLVELHEGKIKFVRFAGNCLIKGNNAAVKRDFYDLISSNDRYKKFFIKDIDGDDDAYPHGCYVGMVRPYVAADPHGDGYRVYMCTSHVLNKRTYDVDYSLCRPTEVMKAWGELNDSFAERGYPYEVKGNGGKGWDETCKFCYYKFNNRLLHTVAQEMPDRNFA